ncbi:unnamed protein product [Vicia faba]|uniref:Uncharacterized protein n=1 Tax=Vicia faba TaxID=3906 RepID=A0AAV0ZXN4_VICFA|nr:unnamed protein product [Vicia faba]
MFLSNVVYFVHCVNANFWWVFVVSFLARVSYYFLSSLFPEDEGQIWRLLVEEYNAEIVIYIESTLLIELYGGEDLVKAISFILLFFMKKMRRKKNAKICSFFPIIISHQILKVMKLYLAFRTTIFR